MDYLGDFGFWNFQKGGLARTLRIERFAKELTWIFHYRGRKRVNTVRMLGTHAIQIMCTHMMSLAPRGLRQARVTSGSGKKVVTQRGP